MPAKSIAQRRLFGMLVGHPGMAAKKGIRMPVAKMKDFAATSEKGLPESIGSLESMQPRKKKQKVGHSVIGNPGGRKVGGMESSSV